MEKRKAELPYPFSTPGVPGSNAVPNLPSSMGEELGKQLARFADIEAKAQPEARPRCDDCAFKLGTTPNRCLSTVADALKCVVEREPFFCHKEDPPKLCAGFILLTKK